MFEKGIGAKKKNETNRDIFLFMHSFLVKKIGDEHSKFGYQTKGSIHIIFGTWNSKAAMNKSSRTKTWKIIIEKNENKNKNKNTYNAQRTTN